MKDLWSKEFRPLSISTPEAIVRYQCENLEKATKGKIISKLLVYNGNMQFFEMKADVNFTEVFKQEDNGFTFEFILTSRSTQNFKYRVMFLQYGVPFYPVKILLDETIANEFDKKQEIICSSQDDFEKTLGEILNSKKVETIINSLLTISEIEISI